MRCVLLLASVLLAGEAARAGELKPGELKPGELKSGELKSGELREPDFPDYSHRAFTGGAVLPADRAFKVLQTADGYLWFGMEAGLVRYDGVHAVRALPAPAGNQDFLMMAEPDGSLWISRFRQGRGELLRFRDGKAEPVSLGPLAKGEPAERRIPLSTLRADNGDLWVGLFFGGAIRIRPNGTADRFGPAEGLPDGAAVTSIVQSAFGKGKPRRILLGTGAAGIFQFQGDRFQPVDGLSGLAKRVEALFASREGFASQEGAVLAGTDAGVFRLTDTGLGIHAEDLGLPAGIVKDLTVKELPVKDVLIDRRGAIWGATNGYGVFRFYQGRLHRFTEREGLSSNVVRGIYEDREGSIWCATRGGSDQFTPVSVKLLTAEQGLPGNSFDSVLRKDGEVWLGRWGGGLFSIKGNRVYSHPGFPPEDSPINLAPRSAGGIWIGSVQGRVGYAENRHGEPRIETWNAGARVDALIEAEDGSLWAALRGRGIVDVRNGNIAPVTFPNAHPSFNLVRGFARTADGAVWVADSLAGLWKIARDGSARRFGEAEGLPAGSLPSALQIVDGRLTVAFPTAIAIAVGDHFKTFGPGAGFCSDEATEIADDGVGGLWLGGPGGIYRLGKAELLSGHPLTCRKYGQIPGSAAISLTRYSHPVIGPAENGGLWFLAERGIAVVRPDLLNSVAVPPLVAIDDIRADGSPLAARGESVGPGISRVQFGFRTIGFAAAEPLRFRYRLEGPRDAAGSSDWRESTEPKTVEFMNLAPGSYRFRVMAFGDAGQKPSETDFPFRIVPHFYQTWWFYGVCAAAALMLGRFGYLLRVRQLQKEFAIVLDERSRMAREIHDTLLQGFAGITWQLDAVARDIPTDPAGSRTRLERLMEQLDRCLFEARQAISSMRRASPDAGSFERTIREMGQMISERHNVRFKMTVRGAPCELSPLARENLFAIAREAVLNVRHANASEIEIALDYTPGAVKLGISDDGAGIPHNDKLPDGHWGIVGMKERAALIGGTFEISRRYPRGTEVTISLPTCRAEAAVASQSAGGFRR
jgi:signal transduction histidine kinase/ligand-binding sensor domain-containing protein